MIHCAQLVCSSTTSPSTPTRKTNTHTGPQGVQDPTRPECGCHSNTDGHEFLALEFLVLTSNRLTNRSWTDTSAQSSLWVSLSQLIFAAAFWESHYPHLNFQTKTLKHSGLPILKSPHLPESRTCIQTQSVPRGASICPWLQSLEPPHVLVSF